MRTFQKARSIQVIIIFTIVILLGAGVTIFSEVFNKREVEGVHDEHIVQEETSLSDLNSVPVFKSEPPINGYVGEEYSYFVSVSDSDSSDLIVTVLKGPGWMEVDELEVYGIPTGVTPDEGIKVILEVSDGINSAYQVFYLNIIER